MPATLERGLVAERIMSLRTLDYFRLDNRQVFPEVTPPGGTTDEYSDTYFDTYGDT